jgi:hypothetical protein
MHFGVVDNRNVDLKRPGTRFAPRAPAPEIAAARFES